MNGSDVVERHVVDADDPASLDRVCRRFAGDMGGVDGCRRWTECCSKAGDCCERQRLQAAAAGVTAASAGVDVAPAAECEATWDGFSCWDHATAGSVVRQHCPVYMDRSDVTGQSLIARPATVAHSVCVRSHPAPL